MDMIFCNYCGEKIHYTAIRCPKCGGVQGLRRKGKSKYVAALLAFLLGGLGVHRFYLEQYWLGICYLAFCWTFIPTIIALLETIAFLFANDLEWEMKYCDKQ